MRNNRNVNVNTNGTVKISGLRPTVTSDDVKEIFDKVGIVTKAFVNFNKNGRSDGSAEVTFAKRGDARNAVREFNGVIPYFQNCVGTLVVKDKPYHLLNYTLDFLNTCLFLI